MLELFFLSLLVQLYVNYIEQKKREIWWRQVKRRSVSIVLAYIVLGSALGVGGYSYFDLDNKHTKLLMNYNSLLTKHKLLQSGYQTLNNTHGILVNDYSHLNQTHHSLLSDYSQLNRTHEILIFEYNELNASYRLVVLNYTELEQDHDELSADYIMLEQNYVDLSSEFAVLQAQYASLFNNYSALLEAFNQPLSYEAVPSTSELEQWLLFTDETDEVEYVMPHFICGDFAVMLSLHAKTKHWDMGIVGVYGYDEFFEPFSHAFNAMICDEGLVYVEPQTDEVWWYGNHEEITEGIWWEFPGFGDIYVEEYTVIVWFE